MHNNEVTVIMIGDTGAGKSSFGNLYLGKNAFEASDSVDPVTLEASTQSNKIDECTRYVIDTAGFNDGQSIESIQIQNLAIFMRKYIRGVNGIAIIINVMNDRFSQGVKDVIRFAYNSFGTKEVLSHICIVFTKCIVKNYPNRETKRIQYKKCVQNYLSEVSGIKIEDIPEIPIFFVDCLPRDDDNETKNNLIQFHGWICSKAPLDTKSFKDSKLHENQIEEIQKRILVGTQKLGDTIYEMFEDRRRLKYPSTNNEPERFTEWTCIKHYEEPIKIEIIEKRNDVDLGFTYNNDGTIKYRLTVNQERKIVRDLRIGCDVDVTGWYNISDVKKIEVGRYTKTIETRQKKFEKKDVTQFLLYIYIINIYHITYTEQRTITKDCNDNYNCSDWKKVPGSENTIKIDSYQVNYPVESYEKEIPC